MRFAPVARWSSSSMSSTPWSAQAPPRGPSTPPTFSSPPWPAVRSSASAPRPPTSTASTSRRTAASFRDKEKKLKDKYVKEEMEWRDKLGATVPEVDEENIAEIVSSWTGVPVSRLVEEESTRLLRMEDDIHARLIGQDDAVKVISQAVRRARAGLKDARRPIGSFIFLGPTGVGKTELARQLARFLLDNAHVLGRLGTW